MSKSHAERKAWPLAIIALACLPLLVALLPNASFADDKVFHKHKPETALHDEQRALLDPGTEGTDDAVLTEPHAGHGKMAAQQQADLASEATIGQAVTQALLPDQGGVWQYAPELPKGFYPIHTIVMTRGVLLVAGSGNSEKNHDNHMYLTYYCNPLLRNCQSIKTPDDLFCGDMLQLQDGTAVMAGGTMQWGSKGWKGAKWVYRFSESTQQWTRVANTKLGRWYPTTVLQTSGRVLIISGIDQNGKLAKKTETYDPKTQKIGSTTGERKFPLYSRFWPTSIPGRYFFDGTGYGGIVGDVPPGYWYPKTNKFVPVKGLRAPQQRSSGATCSIGDYASQNLITFGGGFPVVDYADKITLRGTPVYKPAAALGAKKQYLSCVTLPNGWVFEVGGGSANKIAHASPSASVYKSVNGARMPVNDLPAGEYFLYHNNLVVLDDCRYVALFGSNPASEARNTHVMLWTPPTQVNGCPAFTMPATVKRYGKVKVNVSPDIAYLAVSVPNMVTHSKDNGGRMMRVPVKNGVADFGRILRRYIPENKVKVRAVERDGTWSDAVNVTIVS